MKKRCAECDRIVLAYALAVNYQNEIESQLQEARSADDRQALSDALMFASCDSQTLRTRLMEHCSHEKC